MDMSDIDLKARAADRIAAQKPSGIRAAHCWFCNKIEAWFQCDCPEARDAQQGKRAKPRFDAKRGVMVLDDDIVARNEAWGYKRTPVVGAVSTQPVSTAPAGAVSSPPVSTDRDEARKAYQRDLMRKRRAKQREGDQ
jgi:hypothetical protein